MTYFIIACFAVGFIGVAIKIKYGYERTIRSLRTQVDLLRQHNRQLNERVDTMKFGLSCKEDIARVKNPVMDRWLN